MLLTLNRNGLKSKHIFSKTLHQIIVHTGIILLHRCGLWTCSKVNTSVARALTLLIIVSDIGIFRIDKIMFFSTLSSVTTSSRLACSFHCFRMSFFLPRIYAKEPLWGHMV